MVRSNVSTVRTCCKVHMKVLSTLYYIHNTRILLPYALHRSQRLIRCIHGAQKCLTRLPALDKRAVTLPPTIQCTTPKPACLHMWYTVQARDVVPTAPHAAGFLLAMICHHSTAESGQPCNTQENAAQHSKPYQYGMLSGNMQACSRFTGIYARYCKWAF